MKLLFATLIVMIPAMAFAQPTPPIAGGFTSTAIDDPGVKAAAAYAVSVAPAPAKLKEIVAARQQVVAGMNYSLCLRVVSPKFGLFKHGHLVAAKVFHGLDDHYEVTSWDDVKVCD